MEKEELLFMLEARTPSEMPLVYIVGAENCDVDLGRAQFYPHLKLCCKQAKKGSLASSS
jgi:hypothetical protein